MAKVITFSRYFQKGHPKEGQPTYFVEKVCKSTGIVQSSIIKHFDTKIHAICQPKKHTIRAGNRFKEGDLFSPRVWSGKPYRSPQVVIAPDILIKKVWDLKIFPDSLTGRTMFSINGVEYDCDYRSGVHAHHLLYELAKNDGLELDDFMSWFKYPCPFEGQIISWSGDEGY